MGTNNMVICNRGHIDIAYIDNPAGCPMCAMIAQLDRINEQNIRLRCEIEDEN